MRDGEFGLIERYFRPRGEGPAGLVLGPGDDCAVIAVGEGHQLCVSTDTLLTGVHFPEEAPATVAAARSMAAGVSDLAAMGASPFGVLVALTIADEEHDWLSEFSERLHLSMERFGLSLLGGNFAKGPLSITLTVFGEVPAGEAITRGGANPGDDVYVSGTIGDAAFGLDLWRRGSGPARLLDRYTDPEPRLSLGEALRGVATAMIDVSDGLLADVSHLAHASGCGVELALEAIPFAEDLLALEAFDARLAVTGGDDYELCFTAPAGEAPRLPDIGRQQGLPLTRIGRVVEGRGLALTHKGEPVPVGGDLGYNHFSHGRAAD